MWLWLAVFGCSGELVGSPVADPALVQMSGIEVVDSFVVSIQNPDSAWRVWENARGGVIFDDGEVPDASYVRVYDGWGSEVPFQLHALGPGWPDGSLKRALLQLQVTLAPYGTDSFEVRIYGAPVTVPPSSPMGLGCADSAGLPLLCDSDGDQDLDAGVAEVTASTGAIDMSFRLDDLRLPGRVVRYGTTVIEQGDAAFDLSAYREASPWADADLPAAQAAGDLAKFGYANPASPADWESTLASFTGDLQQVERVTIEESGPVRTVLRFEHDPGSGFGFVARVFLYAWDDAWRTEFTLISQDIVQQQGGIYLPSARHVDHLSWSLEPVGAAYDSSTVGTGTVPARFATTQIDGGSRSDWWTGASSWPAVGDPIDAGWMLLQSPHHSLSVATRHFAETFPKAIAGAPEGLSLELQPHGGPLGAEPWTQLAVMPAGRARTWQWVVDLDSFDGPATAARARHELLLQQDPAWASAREDTFVFATQQDWPNLVGYETSRRIPEDGGAHARVFGERDFGDIRGYVGTGYHFHNQYAPAANDMAWFRGLKATLNGPGSMARNLEAFYRGEAAVWHAMDVDSVNWSPSRSLLGYAPGSRVGREGARQQDHLAHTAHGYNHYHYTTDLVAYYYLTGDRRPVDLILDMFDTSRFDDPVANYLTAHVHDRPTYVTLEGALVAAQAVSPAHIWRPGAVESPDRAVELDLDPVIALRVREIIEKTVAFVRDGAGPGMPPLSYDPADLPSGLFDAFVPGVPLAAQWREHQSACPVFVAHACFAEQSWTQSCPTWTAATCTPALSGDAVPFRVDALARSLFQHWVMTGDTSSRDGLLELADYVAALRLPAGGQSYQPLDGVLRFMAYHDSVLTVTAFASMVSGGAELGDGIVSADYRLNQFSAEGSRMGILPGADRDLHPYLAAFARTEDPTDLTSATWWDPADLTAQQVLIDSLAAILPPTPQFKVHQQQGLCSMVWNVALGRLALYGSADATSYAAAQFALLPPGTQEMCPLPTAGMGLR